MYCNPRFFHICLITVTGAMISFELSRMYPVFGLGIARAATLKCLHFLLHISFFALHPATGASRNIAKFISFDKMVIITKKYFFKCITFYDSCVSLTHEHHLKNERKYLKTHVNRPLSAPLITTFLA